jgi:O-antigen/teichoic acid export membrane protein
MLGHEKTCAVVYVGAFLANLLFCLALVPRFGLFGAAIGASLGMFVEAAALAFAAWHRLGLRLFVWPGAFGR